MNILYFEIHVTTLIKQFSHHLEIPERIGAWIGRAGLNDETLKQTHYDKDYKHYTFGSPFPREKAGVYKQGRVYVITIRSSIEITLRRISAALQALQEDEYFQFIAASPVQSKKLVHITELTTVTPAIVTIEGKPWVPGLSVELLLQRIHANAEKKYNHLYPDQPVRLEQPFIEGIQVLNHKPIALAYKGRKLLGNKLRLLVREDEYSQKLASVVLGSGAAEKNSILGAGFCIAKGLE
ncbi:CRISPR-associated protein Cas6 [Paenibacillus brasilensis]|uniref:CRISPR-associated protein Cas6 n=1 Tax=Paenibacillus brasilensis TaxID=128574 RepID=UPI001FCC1E19|nr:CRISPR-associated protein Cas6 [Paenibacillus brasilensis]